MTTLWGALLANSALRGGVSGLEYFLYEIIHDLAWLAFLASLLSGSVTERSNRVIRYGGVVCATGLLAAGLVSHWLLAPNGAVVVGGQLLIFGSIATSLFALVGIEQVYRNCRPAQQNGLKFLCIGLAGLFAFDLLLYSNAVIAGELGAIELGVRGYVAALCVPLIGVSISRITTWGRGIFASRQIVFYTTAMVASGVYLTVVGFAGFYIQRIGRDWGTTLQLIFFSAAALGFFVLLLSDQIRGRTRTFIAKHFFESKYDYRAEWLRLIQTLTASEGGLPLRKRAIKSVAQIVNSPSGRLWIQDEDGAAYRPVAGWNMQPSATDVPSSDPLVEFFRATGWIVDIAELRRMPERYDGLDVEALADDIAASAFVVPLLHHASLVGFIALTLPGTPVALNFEDHDLLKTAGQQIASYLAQEAATEKLAENRQFEAYNRFTSFVMHDLKNAIAQQSLVVKNAEAHKHNPQFVDDAIETIKGSVTRMKRVMNQLRQRSQDQNIERVDVTKLLLEVKAQCADREPVPEVSIPDDAIHVRANRERLFMAICHAVRNSQDATSRDGDVRMELKHLNGKCHLRISDTGKGMDAEFIRERLFRPFDSTKGAEGMGIGAYQIRETVLASGGTVSVGSVVGQGTTLTLELPLAQGGPS